jgi:hypothetical protein
MLYGSFDQSKKQLLSLSITIITIWSQKSYVLAKAVEMSWFHDYS